MITSFGSVFTVEKIINKLKRAKPDLKTITKMLNSGVGRDPDKKHDGDK